MTRSPRYITPRLLVPLPLIALAGTLLLSACDIETRDSAITYDVPGGDPRLGQRAINAYGCSSCHIVPGVVGANGTVGPPLTHWAEREYIAGSLPNTPENLIFWVQYPQDVEPGTAMPDLDVSEADARNIAAYLYTLK
jgi:cytochrome c1